MAIVKNLVINGIDLLDLIYPIGSIFETTKQDFDPNATFNGTWTRIKGKVLVGVDEDDTDFASSTLSGGEKTHTLTETEMPNHHHEFAGKIDSDTQYQGDWVASWGYSGQYYQDGVWHPRMGNTTSVGGGPSQQYASILYSIYVGANCLKAILDLLLRKEVWCNG